MLKFLWIEQFGGERLGQPLPKVVVSPNIRDLISKTLGRRKRKRTKKNIEEARQLGENEQAYDAMLLLADCSLNSLRSTKGIGLAKKLYRCYCKVSTTTEGAEAGKDFAAAITKIFTSAKLLSADEINGFLELLIHTASGDLASELFEKMAETKLPISVDINKLLELSIRTASWDLAFKTYEKMLEIKLPISISDAKLKRLYYKRIQKTHTYEALDALHNLAKMAGLAGDDKFEVAFDRRSIEIVQRIGCASDERIPLLQPEIFSRFTQLKKETGETLVQRLPRSTKDRILAGQSPRVARSPARHPGPIRVLYVADNWNFSEVPVRSLKENNFDVRLIHYQDFRDAVNQAQVSTGRGANKTLSLPVQSLGPNIMNYREMHTAVEAAFPIANHLIDWCDVVLCEWWTEPATWFSRYLDGSKTLVVRCHSFEAFGTEPFFSNMQGIDGTIFIADHIRNIFFDVFDGVIPLEMKTKVIENQRDLPHLTLHNRSEEQRFTLGLTQYASSNKDPIFAIDILEQLRTKDSRWRLKFIGNPWKLGTSEKEDAYAQEFYRRAQALGDAIIIEPRTNDINSWLHGIGFILSTSYREGSHESLVEGMLTGALPVLRKWPMVSCYGAPESVFPQLPTFETAKDAAVYVSEAQTRFDEETNRVSQEISRRVERSNSSLEFCEFILECHSRRTSGLVHG